MKSNSLNLVERVKAPTPKWFKIIQTIGITLTAVGGYLILGGTVATAISQTAMRDDNDEEAKPNENFNGPKQE